MGIPAENLEAAKDRFPESLTAPIVFYSENMEEAEKAVEIASGWRYKNVTLLEFPGVMAWKEKGYDVNTGPAAEEIVYVRKLEPGQISIADFEAALKSKAITVVDVRGPSEYAAGHFPGAINISLDELPTRLSGDPRQQVRWWSIAEPVSEGEMAYLLLKEKGYDVKYLKAGCQCKSDGTYMIWGNVG